MHEETQRYAAVRPGNSASVHLKGEARVSELVRCNTVTTKDRID
jgi:hypothetical protein